MGRGAGQNLGGRQRGELAGVREPLECREVRGRGTKECGNRRGQGQDYRIRSDTSTGDKTVAEITSWGRSGEGEGEAACNPQLDVRWPGDCPGGKKNGEQEVYMEPGDRSVNADTDWQMIPEGRSAGVRTEIIT